MSSALMSSVLPLASVGNARGRAGAKPKRSVDLTQFISVTDLEIAARERLDPMGWALVDGGAADETTIRWNREAFEQLRLRNRVLVDVSKIDTQLTLFGTTLAHPILLAPTAYHRMIHDGGEIETARGADQAEALFVVSSASTTRIGPIAAATHQPLWFQMYVQSDRGFVKDVVAEVEQAGCRALVVTVDAPVVGPRYRQIRAKFKLTPGLELPYMLDINRRRDSILRGGNNRMNWEEIEWLQSITRLPVLLKGILDPDDAVRALEQRVAGIIVSNHGGRMLDTAQASLIALRAVAARIDGRVPVLMDGGIRRGTDVLKALACGASAVLIGRPYLHGLAVAGSAGVAKTVAILREELEQAMALTGRTQLTAIEKSVLWE
ncbi:MAG: alpha-hydroxy-acid oxidizing protein [Pedosphaera sp.]|nr:alpha-hydroxy-acid oxidizing protein [Pedosphaera sp.]